MTEKESLFDTPDLFGTEDPAPQKAPAAVATATEPTAEPATEKPAPKGRKTARAKKVSVEKLIDNLTTKGHSTLAECLEDEDANDGDDIDDDIEKEEETPEKESKPLTEKELKERKAREEALSRDPLGKFLKEELEKKAAEDPVFAQCYANPKKNFLDCRAYVGGEAFKAAVGSAKMSAVSSDAVLGWALHYYQEESCEPSEQARQGLWGVVAAGTVLTEQDNTELRKQARNAARKEAVEDMKKEWREKIRSGQEKVKLTAEEKKEIDAAAREELVEQSKERQKKNSTRRSTAVKKEDKKPQEEQMYSLF